VTKKENVVTAYSITGKWVNYLLVISQRILRKHMIEALNTSSKCIKNEGLGGKP
jgi:hypothetical protein